MKQKLVLSLVLNIILSGSIIILCFKEKSQYINHSEISQSSFSTYYYTKKSIFEILPNSSNEIIFLGNSITNNCIWSELFDNPNIKNRGIGGDVIEGVSNRIDEVLESKPEKIFLMIGINDLNKGSSIDQLTKHYIDLIQEINARSPSTKLYIQSLLPVMGYPVKRNKDIKIVNSKLQEFCLENNLIYIDLHRLFSNDANELDSKYSFDGLHLNGTGYVIWREAILKYINN